MSHLAPGDSKNIALIVLVTKPSLQAIFVKYCAQRKTPAHFRPPERDHMLSFHEFPKFYIISQTWASLKLFTTNFLEALPFRI